MSHDNQRPSGHGSDGGDDFTTDEHGVSAESPEAGDPYAHAERQGWENQPTTLNDDFGDPESADEAVSPEEDDAAPAKSRGGLMLPLLLCVLVLGAGGFAYWQLVMKPGETSSPQRQAEALPPAGDGQQQASIALPTATPPTPVVEAATGTNPVISPTAIQVPEAVVAQGALAPAQVPSNPMSPVSETSASINPNPEPASETPAPAILPSPPAHESVMPSEPLQEANSKLPLPASTTDIALPTETPSITLNQKPPVVEMPSVPPVAAVPVGTDSKAAKKALESDVIDLKQTVTDLNDKLQQMKAAAARQDAALLQAQTALKAAQAAAKVNLEKPAAAAAVIPAKTHEKVKKQSHAVAHKVVAANKKKPEAKKHSAVTAQSKKAAAKKDVASKTKPDNWVLRSVTADSAWIAPAAAENDLKEVHVGDVVPGVGKIKTIANQDGHWVVEGSIKNLK